MHFTHIFRLIGIMLIFFALTMLPPLVVNYSVHEHYELAFLQSFMITFLSGACLWLSCRHAAKEIQIHDGFLMVILFWGLLCLYSTLPFSFILKNQWSFVDICFECISGLTTTGVSVIAYPEHLPKCLLYYRQQLQFLGGMSIIVLTVAIMPILGVGGTRIYRTETPGALKDTKFTPRITQTAKALWSVYLLLNIICLIFFKCMGATWLDALCESFSTVSTGGLMPHHNGLAFYHNPGIEWGAPIFMILGSINFGTHYLTIKKKTLSYYWNEEEIRFYLTIIFSVLLMGAMLKFLYPEQLSGVQFRHIYFNIISLISSTGSACTDYSHWPSSLIFLLILLALCGGCHGSTTGGLKMIRVLILSKFYRREIKVLLHPQLISHIKYNHKTLDQHILFSLFAFFITFLSLYLILIFLMLLTGNNFITAISVVTGTLSNSGIALGDTAVSFAHLNDLSKLLSMFSMLAGRLEIFSLLIVFSVPYWKD